MATIQYRLSTRVANGSAEVLVRFFDGSFSQRAKSHVFCPVSAWNDKDGLPALPKRITAQVGEISEARIKLERVRDYVYARWFVERYDARDGWLQQKIDECLGIRKTDEPKTLRDVFEEYAEAHNLDVATRKSYNVLLSALDRFAGIRKMYVADVRVQDIDAFCAFYRKEKLDGKVIDRSQNTITSKLKRWRALQNFAVLRGYAQSSPFAQFSIPAEVYGTPIFLTTEERDALYAFDGLTPAMQVQRDIFVFQCHVGCRVSDLLSLTKDNITPDGFLQYIPQKQRRRVPLTVRVPLSPVAQEIVTRYADCSGERLLPFISDVNYNVAIHDIMKTAGLDRTVMVLNPKTLQPEYKPLYEATSSHTARKTFIEAMFRATKSERITSAFTGHVEGSKAFSRYTDVDDEMKKEIIEKLTRN